MPRWASSTTTRSQGWRGSASNTCGCLRKSSEAIEIPGRSHGFSARRRRPHPSGQPVGIHHPGVETKARVKLCRPLIAQWRRDHDQDARRRIAANRFGDDESGLDRLAQPDFIGDQDPSRAGQRRQRRFELVREQIDRGIDGRGDGSKPVGSSDEMCETRQRLLWTHPREPVGTGDGRRPIEGRKEGQPRVAVGDVEPDDTAITPDAFDAPAPLPNPDEISGQRKRVHFLPLPTARRTAETAILTRRSQENGVARGLDEGKGMPAWFRGSGVPAVGPGVPGVLLVRVGSGSGCELIARCQPEAACVQRLARRRAPVLPRIPRNPRTCKVN